MVEARQLIDTRCSRSACVLETLRKVTSIHVALDLEDYYSGIPIERHDVGSTAKSAACRRTGNRDSPVSSARLFSSRSSISASHESAQVPLPKRNQRIPIWTSKSGISPGSRPTFLRKTTTRQRNNYRLHSGCAPN
jgi:hypothetical protein